MDSGFLVTSDAGRDLRQEEKGTTEDEMVGWDHRLDGHEFDQTPGDDERQGSLVCCGPWGCKELDTAGRRDGSSKACLMKPGRRVAVAHRPLCARGGGARPLQRLSGHVRRPRGASQHKAAFHTA